MVSAGKLKLTNPKCQVRCSITGNFSDPSVEVEFSEFVITLLLIIIWLFNNSLVDGSKMQFESAKFEALDMVAKINTKAKTL